MKKLTKSYLKALTYEIIGAAIEVHKEMGFSDNFSGTPIKTGQILGNFTNFPSIFTYLH